MGVAMKRGRRERTKRGVYRRCRRGFLGLKVCPGYSLTKNGVEVPHRACGGDGWIKVGTKKKGRRPARPGTKKRRRPRARPRTVLVSAVGAYGAAEVAFGAIGRTAVTVAVVVFFVLRMVVLVGERVAR